MGSMPGSKIFLPSRGLGYVSNHLPLQVRYIKSRKENLIVTCVGKSFHTYGISHFGLLSVSGLHPGEITSISSDTYHIYTACDKVVYAWRRGTELKHVYRGHEAPVHLLMPFGPHLISVDSKSLVKIWDIKEETIHLELLFDNKSFQITSLLHPSTYVNKILFGSESGALQLWNINTSKMIYQFKGWGEAVMVLEQAPALDVVAVGTKTGRIVLHNLKFDETIMEFTQDAAVTGISFRTDGPAVMATGSSLGHVVFWDLEERRVTSQLRCAHEAAVTGMVCLPNEPLILTSSSDNTLKLWIFDMSDGGARLLRIREGHSSCPSFIRYHGNQGHNILSAAGDSTLRIFNTKTEQFNKSLGRASYNRKASKKRGRLAEDPLKMPPIIEFTSETTREKEWDNIAAAHLGLSMVTTWSYDKVKMGELKMLPERFHKKNRPGDDVAVACLFATHCGNFVVVGYNTGHIDRFNMQSGLWRDTYGSPKAHKYPVRGVAVDSLNQLVVSGGSNGSIRFWTFKNKGTQFFTSLQTDDPISFFRTHSESSLIAIALEDFSTILLDLDTKRIVRKFLGHSAQITDACFSPDGRWLITSSMDCSIRTWDIPSSQLIDEFSTESACISLSLSPTGEALATAHVDYLGIFLWTNRTLYAKVTLRALTPSDSPPLAVIPECQVDLEVKEEQVEDKEEDFLSPEQISSELITLSGLSASRWLNLLNIDLIRKRNKPKEAPKAPKAAPFFLPTLPSLNFQFDLTSSEGLDKEASSRLLTPQTLVNLSEFGKILDKTRTTNNFTAVIAKLKTLGPSMIDFEVKGLAPEGGGSVEVMLQFLKCIESMLKSHQDFELAEAYLSVFLKSHGNTIAEEALLRTQLVNVQSCHNVSWQRLQDKLLYGMSVVKALKTM